MAEGFTRKKASSILKSVMQGCYVALSTSTPDQDGGNFIEPNPSSGYQRQSIGALDDSVNGQLANESIIFLFEAIEDIGSVTHVGLSDNIQRGSDVFLMAKLNPALTVGAGYVPLIRAHGLVVGLDVSQLQGY